MEQVLDKVGKWIADKSMPSQADAHTKVLQELMESMKSIVAEQREAHKRQNLLIEQFAKSVDMLCGQVKQLTENNTTLEAMIAELKAKPELSETVAAALSSEEDTQDVRKCEKNVPVWPQKRYAGNYSSYDPLGFTHDDLSADYADQLFIIELQDEDTALYHINLDMEFGTLLSSFKYVLKDVCEVAERSVIPTSMSEVEPGKLTHKNDIWEIEKKIVLNIK